MSNNIIPIFFNTDNNYTVPTYITLFSLLYNYRGLSDIHAYILAAENFSEKNKLLLDSLSNRFKQVKIRIINIENGYDDVSIKLKHISKAAFYRLMIPRIANALTDSQIDKCIYLDSDLIVEGNIAELFNIDIKGHYIAGVGDGLQFLEKDTNYKNVIGIPSFDKYINSGVLLFNIKEINNCDGLKERLEKSGYRDNLLYPDQDSINSVLYDGIKLLPLKYNTMTTLVYSQEKEFYIIFGEKNIIEARKNPFIIHYITDKKPWLYRTSTMSRKWWRYVKMQDQKVFCEYIKPLLKTHSAPPFERIQYRAKHIAKIILKHLGIFDLINSLVKKDK